MSKIKFMLSYVKKCAEKDYTISFEPNLPKWHVFDKIHFDFFDIFGSAGRAEPFKWQNAQMPNAIRNLMINLIRSSI